jgi:dTDP-4-amino-4,6-dideoxygalactose transaminase
LRVKLAHLDEWNARRTGIAQRYQQCLLGSGLTLPHVPDWAEPVWHLYVVQHPQRNALQKAMTHAGVGTLIHYPIAPHRQQAYAHAGWVQGSLPLAERMADHVLSLPMGPTITEADVNFVVQAVQISAREVCCQ